MRFLGIDLHSNNLVVTILLLTSEGIKQKKSKYYFKNGGLEEFKSILTKEDHVVIESTQNAFWFYDQIINLVKEVYIYDTNKGRNQGNKTDKIDSTLLAYKLLTYIQTGSNTDALPTVYVPKPKVRELRSLVSTYMFCRKMTTQLKNRIHALTKQNGVCIKMSDRDKHFLDDISTHELPTSSETQINILYETLTAVLNQKLKIKDQIFILGTELFNKEIKLLLSIKGFSAFTAITLMSDVCVIDRFKNVKKFCSYLRTAPKIKSSNKTTHVGKINKQSRANTCVLLTQSVIHLKNASDHINAFYNRVGKGKSAGKIRMAIIRKILVSAYHMLKYGQTYKWKDNKSYERKLMEYDLELRKAKARIKGGEKYKLAS